MTRENEVKSYKWGDLKNSPPKNAVIYVLNKNTNTVEVYITDKNGNPKPINTGGGPSTIDISDYVRNDLNNNLTVISNKLFSKKYVSGDSVILVEENSNNYTIKLKDGVLELLENKQDNLTPDGTGTKYPTVDAVNDKFQELEEEISNVSGDKTYVHEQVTPSKVWEYEHGLGKRPSVQVTDSAGTVMMGQITVNDGIKVRIEFNIAFWGYATNN